MNDAAYQVISTRDSGYAVCGVVGRNGGDVVGGHSFFDCWVIKLSAAGSLVWQKPLGGSVNEYAYSIQQTFDNGYIVAGYTTSSDSDVSGNHGGLMHGS